MIRHPVDPAERLLSLDVFRGITMFLLTAEGAYVYDALTDLTSSDSFWEMLVGQFHHHAWNGLHFWDLVQPYFMFIVGVALAYSVKSRSDWSGAYATGCISAGYSSKYELAVMALHPIDWTIIGLFLIFSLLVGLAVSRRAGSSV